MCLYDMIYVDLFCLYLRDCGNKLCLIFLLSILIICIMLINLEIFNFNMGKVL